MIGELIPSVTFTMALFLVVIWYQRQMGVAHLARLRRAEQKVEAMARELEGARELTAKLETQLAETRALNAVLRENNTALRAQIGLWAAFTGVQLPEETTVKEAREVLQLPGSELDKQSALLAILCSPAGMEELNFDPEIERLRDNAGHWNLLLETGEVTRDSIARALDNNLSGSELVALFYAGHGEGRNLMLAQGPHIDPEWLGTFVRNYGVECVILAACRTDEFAAAVEGVANLQVLVTIGGAIEDSVANVIGVTMLEHIGRKRTIQSAKRSLDVRLSNRQSESVKIYGNPRWRWPHRRKNDLRPRGGARANG